MSQTAEITNELARGKFTEEMLADMRALGGTELRTEASINNEYATRFAILRFAEGIGDDNPLWTDQEYAARSVHGGLIAPPSFIFACLASVQVGWRGLGGFHAETTLTFHRNIRVGDKIEARVWFDGFDEPVESSFGGRRIKDYVRQEYQESEQRARRDLHLLADAFRAHGDAKARVFPCDPASPPLDGKGDCRNRGAGSRGDATGSDATLLGRRERGRRHRHAHQGTYRSH